MSRTLGLVAVLLVCVGLLAGVSTLAQEDPGGGPGGGGGRRGGMMGPPMGGGSALVAHKDHLYVLTGTKLVKVDPLEMKVVGELELGGGAGSGGRRPPRPGEGEEGR